MKKICTFCGREFETPYRVAKFCSQECLKAACSDFQTKKHSFTFEDEPLGVHLQSNSEVHSFKTLKQAYNFLSTFTEFDGEVCLNKLKMRENKIGIYRVEYTDTNH